MMARSTRGFTLIELLIVVAMITIMAASSLMVIVAPMRDEVSAWQAHEFEAGAATLFSKLVEDAHRAQDLVSSSPEMLRLVMPAGAGRDVFYGLAKGTITRTTFRDDGATVTANLIQRAEKFSLDREGTSTLWRITVRGAAESMRPGAAAPERSMMVAIGTESWASR